METIRVQMTRELLFDFLLYHTYSKAFGFLVNMLGLGVAAVGGVMQAMGQIKTGQLALYLLAAAAFLLYTPLLLRRRAKKQMQVNPEYRDPREYVFSEDGVRVVQNEEETLYDWSRIERTVTTPKTIGIYYGKDRAFIIPKTAFGDRFVPVMQMVVQHIGLNKVRLTQ